MEDYDRIKSLLKGSDMVFITAGEGGGTGTGAAPVVARIARELGALTVGIVTKPFGFEGSRRMQAAEHGHRGARARRSTPSSSVPNNRLLTVLDKQTSMVEAFRVADDVLRQGVQGISDLITLPGLINLDFADVRTIMSEAGNALLGIGMGTGEKRAVEAAEAGRPRRRCWRRRSRARAAILLSITGGRDLSLWEVNEAAQRRPGGRAPGREHHLRRDARREARGRGVDHRRRDRLRRQAARRGARSARGASASRSASRASRARARAAGVRPRHRRRRARVHPAVSEAVRWPIAASSRPATR